MSSIFRGRPKKSDPRKHIVKVRLNEEELGMVLYYVDKTGESYSDILRKALKFYYSIDHN